MALPSSFYSKPIDVAMICREVRKESNSCQDCKHRFVLWGTPVCTKTTGLAGIEMVRCEMFDKRTDKKRPAKLATGAAKAIAESHFEIKR